MHEAEDTREETRSVTSQEARELAARFHADADWDESVREFPYTIELAQAMMPPDSTPILFIGTVIDIEESDSLIVVEFSPSLSDYYFAPSVNLRVSGCNRTILRSLMDEKDRYLADWAVVSRVASIERLQTVHEAWEDADRVATGDCRAIILLPEGYSRN